MRDTAHVEIEMPVWAQGASRRLREVGAAVAAADPSAGSSASPFVRALAAARKAVNKQTEAAASAPAATSSSEPAEGAATTDAAKSAGKEESADEAADQDADAASAASQAFIRKYGLPEELALQRPLSSHHDSLRERFSLSVDTLGHSGTDAALATSSSTSASATSDVPTPLDVLLCMSDEEVMRCYESVLRCSRPLHGPSAPKTIASSSPSSATDSTASAASPTVPEWALLSPFSWSSLVAVTGRHMPSDAEPGDGVPLHILHTSIDTLVNAITASASASASAAAKGKESVPRVAVPTRADAARIALALACAKIEVDDLHFVLEARGHLGSWRDHNAIGGELSTEQQTTHLLRARREFAAAVMQRFGPIGAHTAIKQSDEEGAGLHEAAYDRAVLSAVMQQWLAASSRLPASLLFLGMHVDGTAGAEPALAPEDAASPTSHAPPAVAAASGAATGSGSGSKPAPARLQ